MTEFREFAKTDEFKQAVRDAIPDLVSLNFTTGQLFRARVNEIIRQEVEPVALAVRDLREELTKLQSRVTDDSATRARALEARITLLEQACSELLAEARQARGERVDEATDHSGPARLDIPNPGIV